MQSILLASLFAALTFLVVETGAAECQNDEAKLEIQIKTDVLGSEETSFGFMVFSDDLSIIYHELLKDDFESNKFYAIEQCFMKDSCLYMYYSLAGESTFMTGFLNDEPLLALKGEDPRQAFAKWVGSCTGLDSLEQEQTVVDKP